MSPRATMQRRYRTGASAQPQAQVDPTTGSPVDSEMGATGGQGGGPQADAASPYNPGAIPSGSPDTSWFNPYNASVSGQATPSLSSSSVPYYNGSDIAQQYVNNRNTQQNEGDRFSQYFNDQASQRAGAEQAAGAKANQLYTGLEQTPGYTQSQKDAILGNNPDGSNNYQNLLNTDYGANYLSSDEQAKMSGSPYDPTKQLDSGILDDVNSTANNMRSGATDNAEARLKQNYETTNAGLNGAIDPNQLNVSKGYQDNTSNVLTTTGNAVTGAANNSDLQMSGEYGKQAGMTDQEVADTAAIGGQAVGAQSRSAIQDLERQAAASGNSSPLAVAAARREFEDQNAVQGADATVNAQLAGRNAQRQAATGVESTRLGATQYQTGAQIQGAEAMGTLAQGALDTGEKLRMAGAQDVSNRQMNAASTMGTMGQNNASTILNSQTGNANQYQAGGQAAGEFNQSMGYGAAANAEASAANRAGTIATNRQNTSQTNQGNTFNRGYQTQAQLSGLQTGVANQDLTGQQKVRDYYTGQQQYQGSQGNQAQSNMLTNRQQTQTGVNQATQGSANWENMNKQNPSIGGALAKQAASTALTAAQKPQ